MHSCELSICTRQVTKRGGRVWWSNIRFLFVRSTKVKPA